MKTPFVKPWLLFFLVGLALAGPVADRAVFSLTIDAKQDTVRLGSNITVDLTMRNISDQDHWYNPSDFGEDINVTDEKGDAVNPTKEGEVYKRTGDNPRPQPDGSVILSIRGSGGKMLTMKPGESATHEIMVSKLFEFQRAGKYAIQATEFDPGTNAPVKSNVVKVTVVP
jgi:hypothetical protein